LVLGITTLYFIFITYWKPYYAAINKHNYFLKLNHGTVVIFLVICEIFAKVDKLPS